MGCHPCILKWKLCKNDHYLQTLGIYRGSWELWAGNRRFIKTVSSISFPLYQMLQKGAKFIWSDDAQKAFEQLKQKLTEPPVLIHPGPKKALRWKLMPAKLQQEGWYCRIKSQTSGT